MADIAISPRDFHELLDNKHYNVIPIDTRNVQSFNEGHIQGAVHIPELFTYCILFHLGSFCYHNRANLHSGPHRKSFENLERVKYFIFHLLNVS